MNKQFFVLLLLFTLCYSCETASYSDQNKESAMTLGDTPSPPPAMEYIEEEYLDLSQKREPEDRQSKVNTIPKQTKRKDKIIKRGYIQALVSDIQKGKKAIDHILNTHKSHYENESYSDSDYESVYNLTIRIPTESFNSFVNSLGSSDAKILSKQISSENVTGEYFDIKVALENKERYLEQYRELLKKTGSVKDLLEVQERIRRLSEEMDVSKGRLAYLDDNVNYSTLNLTLTQRHERIISKTPNNFGQRIINAFKNGGESIVSVLIFLVAVWPLVLLLALILIFRKYLPSRAQFLRRKKS